MKVMAQMAMVMNLDKCIGCHTCSVTCKQAWTNRSGTEYVWFNNVETRPGQGYPRTYEDQDRWRGGWMRDKKGRLRLRDGGRLHKLLRIFANPKLPSIDDYYEPWTYDYENLTTAPPGDTFPTAAPRSLISGEPMKIRGEPNWDDNLAGSPEIVADDPVLKKVSEEVKLELEADLHVLPAPDLRALPQPVLRGVVPVGGDVQAQRGRHRAGRPGPLPRLADVCVRMSLQEGVFQPQDRQGREVHAVLPADGGRPADGLLGDLRGAAALPGLVLYDVDRVLRGGLGGKRHRPLPGAVRDPAGPERSGGDRRRAGRGHLRRVDRGRAAFPGVRADQHLPGGAAAASGIPHHADGLVHPAAVPGGRRGQPRRARRGGPRQPVRRAGGAAHPDGVPGRAVHRRRHRPWSKACCAGWRRCAPTCATSTSAARPSRTSRIRSA